MGSAHIDAEIASFVSESPFRDVFIKQAEFAYRSVAPALDALPPGSEVLEIGSGSCVLISQLQKNYSRLRFSGVEPMGPGFAALPAATTAMSKRFGFELHQVSYERLAQSKRFDFIFSNNVFEHLPDWRAHLRFVDQRLRPGGKCMVLCPNHGFPYESHFGVPILFNKKITYQVFRRRIEQFENEHDARGLWASLNFVTWAELSREVPKLGLHVVFDPRMNREMIARLDEDAVFLRMHGRLAWFAKLLLRTGVVGLFELPAFWRFHPYMRLQISKS